MEKLKKKKLKARFLGKDDVLKTLGGLDRLYMQGAKSISIFQKFLNEKRFRVADTSLSYRQINSLDNNEVLKDERKKKEGWRKFSLKELIFFSIIKELRIYGIRDKQLENLRDAFFRPKYKKQADFAVMMTFIKLHIILAIDSESKVNFYDTASMELFLGKSFRSIIEINLNEIVMDLWEKIGGKRKEYKNNNEIMGEIIDDFDLNKKELEIMKIIRDKEYRNITIKKNGQEEFIVKGEKTDMISEKDLLEMIKKKDFADIKVVKRDGNIVNIKIEDTYKV